MADRTDPEQVEQLFATPGLADALESDRFKPAPRDLRRELTRVDRISYLAPDIVAAIVEGRQPGGLRSRKLERGELPFCWTAQRDMLGFE